MIALMTALPQALYRATETRELDRCAIQEAGIPANILMERAGAALFKALRERWPTAGNVGIVCGQGNNGGDGFIVARLAQAAGLQVRVWLCGDPARLSDTAHGAFEALRAAGVRLEPAPLPQRPNVDVIVDALFGTGLDRELSGASRATVEAINASGVPVLAADIPSGLHADTGGVLGAAVQAQLTVTFIGLKQGLLTGEGPGCSGELLFDDLGVPAAVYAHVPPSALCITQEVAVSPLSPRSRSAHKGSCGHVLVIGGAPGMSGAARLAGEAALRVGAGLVSVATHPQHVAMLNVGRPELMCHAVRHPQALAPLLRRATVIAIGPGLGQDAWAQGLLAAALEVGQPLIVDADALNMLAADPRYADNWILTPHPGEAARLLGCSTAEVQNDRYRAVAELQVRYGGVAVLKGAGSLVRQEGRLTHVCDRGNPGMASGGMGDVLTGMIGGLRAQGLSAWNAALAAVYVHAWAGDVAAEQGERGLLAGDLLPEVRKLVNPGGLS